MRSNIELSFPYTFLDRVMAEFVLIPDSKFKVFIHSLIPLIGVAILTLLLWQGKTVSLDSWLVVLGIFFFGPGLIVFGLCINYITNKASREPFTYMFDDNGIRVSAISHEFTHRWPAISKVKPTQRYLLFFFAPGAAHCIPMRAVKNAGALDTLLELARSKGVKIVDA